MNNKKKSETISEEMIERYKFDDAIVDITRKEIPHLKNDEGQIHDAIENMLNSKPISGVSENIYIKTKKIIISTIKFMEDKNPNLKKLKQEFKLKLITKHLPLYNSLDKAIALYGDEYSPIKKLLYYKLIGNTQKGQTSIKIGGCQFDTRVNIMILMNSGSGKNNLKQALIKCAPEDLEVREATSFHQEQFIGKMVWESVKVDENTTEKQIVEKRGYFDADEILIDESRHLSLSKEQKYQEARSFFCIALDPIGNNKINKQLVDHGSENRLEYYAKCSATLFSQPVKIIQEVIESGYIRRFILVSFKNETDIKDIFKKRLYGEDRTQYYEEFKKYLKKILIPSIKEEDFGIDEEIESPDISSKKWTFFEGAEKIYLKYSVLLTDLCLEYSQTSKKFVNDIFNQTILDLLLKFSCITSVYFDKDRNITENNIKMAYMDLFEFMCSFMDTVTDFTEDFYTFNINEDNFKYLGWLYQYGSLNEEITRTSIKDFKEFIAQDKNIKRSDRTYFELLKYKLIESKRIEKHNSKVWLTKKGKMLVESNNEFIISDKTEYYDEYLKICEEILQKHINTTTPRP